MCKEKEFCAGLSRLGCLFDKEDWVQCRVCKLIYHGCCCGRKAIKFSDESGFFQCCREIMMLLK